MARDYLNARVALTVLQRDVAIFIITTDPVKTSEDKATVIIKKKIKHINYSSSVNSRKYEITVTNKINKTQIINSVGLLGSGDNSLVSAVQKRSVILLLNSLSLSLSLSLS